MYISYAYVCDQKKANAMCTYAVFCMCMSACLSTVYLYVSLSPDNFGWIIIHLHMTRCILSNPLSVCLACACFLLTSMLRCTKHPLNLITSYDCT